MQARIPISVVLEAAKGSRHYIPHCTYRADKNSAFFSYLDSEDRRLPDHSSINLPSCDPTDFDTYVGEELWDDHGAPPPPPAEEYDEVVSWVEETLERSWAKDGVVLYGRYGIADDCEWALSSRTFIATNVRDVFSLMKMSIKFTADIHAQRTEAEGTFSDVEFTLVGSLEGPECREMRAFMPYLLRDGRTELLEDYIGMSQRLTDSCFPPLGEWTEEEHHENFGIVCDRLKRLDLLGAMGHFQPSWLEQLAERFRSNANNKKKRDAGNSNDNQEQQASTEGDLIVMLAVDFFFDTPTCPIFVTSAKVRLFESKGGLSPPYLREADEEEEPAETEETKSNATEVEEETIVRFFRLFRDEVHWNRYLDEVHKRKNAALGEENKPDGAAWKRYFVFAAEFSDLVQTGEAFDRMGLPLEFRQPELLANNPELAAVVKEIMENMNKQKIYL